MMINEIIRVCSRLYFFFFLFFTLMAICNILFLQRTPDRATRTMLPHTSSSELKRLFGLLDGSKLSRSISWIFASGFLEGEDI